MVSDDRPVLILHGWGGGSDSWVRVSENLAESGYKVICPDLPGFGKSQEPSEAWDIGRYADFIGRFAQAMDINGFFLCGHSFGGGVALVFAATHPQHVKMLALCDAAIIRKERLSFRQRVAKMLTRGKDVLLSIPVLGPLVMAPAQKIVYKIAGVSDYYRATPVMRETFKNITREDLSKYAPDIKIPAMIVWGRNDLSTPIEDAYTIQHLMIGSVLKIIEGVGHNPNRGKHRELADMLAAFFGGRAV